jgi:hypothetical protein
MRIMCITYLFTAFAAFAFAVTVACIVLGAQGAKRYEQVSIATFGLGDVVFELKLRRTTPKNMKMATNSLFVREVPRSISSFTASLNGDAWDEDVAQLADLE